MTTKDRREFEQYLAQCTDRQVLGVYEKERDARRWDYARLAKSEMRSRGIEN